MLVKYHITYGELRSQLCSNKTQTSTFIHTNIRSKSYSSSAIKNTVAKQLQLHLSWTIITFLSEELQFMVKQVHAFRNPYPLNLSWSKRSLILKIYQLVPHIGKQLSCRYLFLESGSKPAIISSFKYCLQINRRPVK